MIFWHIVIIYISLLKKTSEEGVVIWQGQLEKRRVLYGKDAERFEKEIRETQPLSEERKSEMREQYKSFMRKVNIKVEKKRWI